MCSSDLVWGVSRVLYCLVPLGLVARNSPLVEQPSSLIYALRSPVGYVSVLPLGIGRATLHTADILELATRWWY